MMMRNLALAPSSPAKECNSCEYDFLLARDSLLACEFATSPEV
jgi:hypothetical protein